jgi:hypothetical protein
LIFSVDQNFLKSLKMNCFVNCILILISAVTIPFVFGVFGTSTAQTPLATGFALQFSQAAC